MPEAASDSPASVIELTLEQGTEAVDVDGTLAIYPNIESKILVEFA